MSYERITTEGLTADDIWRLEEAGLANPDEIAWRKRDDARTGKERPVPPAPRWAPLSATEFEKLVGRDAFGAGGFGMESYGFYQAYNDYLKGFFQELGRKVGNAIAL